MIPIDRALVTYLHLHQLHLHLHGLVFSGGSATLLSNHSSDLCLSLKQKDLLLLLLLKSSGDQVGIGGHGSIAVEADVSKSVNKLSGLVHEARLEGAR